MVLHLVLDVVEDILGNLPDGLDELRLTRIAFVHSSHELLEVDMARHAHRRIRLMPAPELYVVAGCRIEVSSCLVISVFSFRSLSERGARGTRKIAPRCGSSFRSSK